MTGAPILIGDVVAGKYRVERVLGEGGMGVVFAALHITLETRVAIKVLRPEAASNADVVARFLREARACVRFKGEHVARVLDVGALDDGSPFMVMEHLEGADLGSVVETSGPLPVPLAVDYLLQACEALAEAHALGIVHRDIKPSNLFLTQRADGSPQIKVLDFGISKLTSALDVSKADYGMTQTQSVMGSPQYMAPEQMRSSRRVDGRTDIWAVGTVLYELLTAEPPFSAATMPELFAMILTDPTPSLRARRPEVPEGLDALAAACLAKDPLHRPATIAEVARALAPYGGPGARAALERVAGVTARASSPSLEVPASSAAHEPAGPTLLASATTGEPPSAGAPRRAGRRRFGLTGLVAAAAAATSVLGLAAFVVARGGGRPKETPGSEALRPTASVAPSARGTPGEPTHDALPPVLEAGAPDAGVAPLAAPSRVPSPPEPPKPRARSVPPGGRATTTPGGEPSRHVSAPGTPTTNLPAPPTTASSRYD